MWASEAVRDALGFEDLIGQFGTSFESERFGKDKGIIAIEEDLIDLRVKVCVRPLLRYNCGIGLLTRGILENCG